MILKFRCLANRAAAQRSLASNARDPMKIVKNCFGFDINPVIIFVSIFFWGWLWGPVGVLLAVPLMTVIQVVLKQIPRLRPVYRVIAR